MNYAALSALALSAIPILVLCFGDPKRRRTAGDEGSGMSTRHRRLLVAVAALPGFICAAIGDAAAFLMWLGGCDLMGWACARCFRTRIAPDRSG